MPGYVYFLSNPTMPDLLKIGMTTRSIHERLSELRSTSVADSFVLEGLVRVENPEVCERLIHCELKDHRYSDDREFFSIGFGEAFSRSWQHVKGELLDENAGLFVEMNPHPFPGLTDDEEQLLWAVMDKPQWVYYDWAAIRNQLGSGWSDDEVKLLLFDLKAKGFLKERKSRNQQYDSSWELDHKGLRYSVWLNKDKPDPNS